MKNASIPDIVSTLLLNGYSVCYMDQDRDRRLAVEARMKGISMDRAVTMNGMLSGRALPHYNCVIAVNTYDFDPMVQREWKMIAGLSGGIKPLIMELFV